MNRILSILLLTFLLIASVAEAQKKECKLKPKRFPSSFSHLSSDYANMNLQTDVLPKNFAQFETSLSFGSLFKYTYNEKYYSYNSNLVRIGLGRNLEVRALFSIPGKNTQLNYSEIEKMNSPLGASIKANLFAESGRFPGMALSAQFMHYNNKPHYQASIIVDKYFFNVLKTSVSLGPEYSGDGDSRITYSLGVTMKDRFHKLGVYALASNRYAYIKNIFHMGLVYSDNLNYLITAGYGVHQDHGLFMVSYTGIINYRYMQKKFLAYF